NAVWDRETAIRAGRESTGHGLPPGSRGEGSFATAVAMAPGEAESTDQLAELVGDGIYVTRLHYLGIVNAREGVLTGMTKDGTFRIRDGKVAEPLVNLRFTISVPELLADVPGLTRDVKLVNLSDFYDERWAYGYRVRAVGPASLTAPGAGPGPGLCPLSATNGGSGGHAGRRNRRRHARRCGNARRERTRPAEARLQDPASVRARPEQGRAGRLD